MTRTPEDLAKLFAYGRWATGLTLTSVPGLERPGRPQGAQISHFAEATAS